VASHPVPVTIVAIAFVSLFVVIVAVVVVITIIIIIIAIAADIAVVHTTVFSEEINRTGGSKVPNRHPFQVVVVVVVAVAAFGRRIAERAANFVVIAIVRTVGTPAHVIPMFRAVQ
jgi:hypothetical protein